MFGYPIGITAKLKMVLTLSDDILVIVLVASALVDNSQRPNEPTRTEPNAMVKVIVVFFKVKTDIFSLASGRKNVFDSSCRRKIAQLIIEHLP